MKDFFTISEFGNLRGVNINSMRYYEKIGLLKPDSTDSKTKYRYYSIEQLVVLDAIPLCLDLGAPLKDLKNYVSENGEMQNRKLLEDSKLLVQKRMKKIQSEVPKIEYSIAYLNSSDQY